MSQLGNRILKVDHAGEHGAVNIYKAQILVCRWRAPQLVAELIDFQRHEERHRALFGEQLRQRDVRRCRSYHFCGIGGWTLGFLTGLAGATAVAATSVAVERVVLRHLDDQLQTLSNTDQPACSVIAEIIEEERQHHDLAKMKLSQGPLWPTVLLPIVSLATESVIWLGMRL